MAKNKRSTVRLDDPRFASGDVYSVRAEVELENGFVGVLGDIEEDNRDIRKLETPQAGDSLVIIANPALIYDNARLGSDQETNYFMEAGEAVRAYKPHATYVFSVSEEGIEGKAEKGKYLVAGKGNKLVVADAAPEDATGFVGKVIRKDVVGGALSVNVQQSPTTYVVIDTIQN
ncbi:hypothetical protein [Siminovitchia sp. 179-K 8D1 HS]|uniref:hypothetical protein n=1 Tax=Siminovitchia sp. 179-K 8D1 HS TaxID=3142385 RepID=UPI0039A344BF